ncbi:MAG: methionyl-tRNA formyltransferase [Burkholderiaceae bacterium]
MKLIFAGTPVFAAQALEALIAAGHEIALVLTQPDRPAGRGKKLQASAVKQLATDAGLEVFQPGSLRKDRAACERIAAVGAQAMVVAAYGLILPLEVLQAPRLGCLNIHASLLPRWRGAAPIQRAIEAGDTETGITIMQMDEGLDTGDMLLVRPTPIDPLDTGASLHDRLAGIGAQAIVDALNRLSAGELSARPQPDDGATYAHRLTRSDGWIDWTLCAPALVNRIRAFDPVPGNAARLGPGQPVIKIWAAQVATAESTGSDSNDLNKYRPGEVVSSGSDHLVVACANGGLIRVLELQRAGARRLPVAQFQPGGSIAAGMQFVAPDNDG